jgi:Holliday junction resolvasome RuvABC endonuclease subunit
MGTPILALDLGTTTGWALLTSDGCTLSGSQSFKPQRFDGGGMRYLRFTRWLAEVCPLARTEVVYEEVRRHLGVDAAHAYGGFLSHLQSFCEQREIPYSGVPVSVIKKFITGKGNASKEMVIEAVKSHGYNPADDNEADALALLRYVRSINNQT